ncbi:coiled-coil domain-containing protein 13-like [Dendronephthya gigantea]|uniref:coiled-coil domain-containing protein 13-like n=1 Tax=Dendronephthya gigantea TaxID=151771 RepID=UPI001069D825|nr:coiled-coil domain-containing protein 13-like [Dendronephthya gigantea]
MDIDSNGSDSLRQQFQLLQEQHKKKLLLRKQKLSTQTEVTADQKPEYMNSVNGHGSTIIEDVDNLELQLNSNLSEDFSRTSEYDNKIRELKDENGRLYKLLAERDEEMRILRKQINSERQAIAGSGPGSDTAANRIMELSRKNRELASEIEKEKRKAKQLSKKITDMESQNSSMAAQVTKHDTQRSKDVTDEGKNNSQVLEEKLKQALAKVAEYRNQCEILKKEARIAQKVIAKECGEGMNVTAVLNEPSGWRGRQQQITTLQNKVNELKAQLNDVMHSKQALSTNGLPNQNYNVQRVMTPSFHDEKHKQMLKKMEKSKKEEYEKTSGELHLLNEEHQKLQTKFDAAKTRNKILTGELKSLKEKTKMLAEKGAHDDELISALMREQERLKKTVEKKNSQIAERSQSRHEKVQQDTELVATLTQLCKEREEKVAQLERELNSLAMNLAEAPARRNIGSADKATITDEVPVERISSSFNDHQQNTSETMVSKPKEVDGQSRGRRIVRSTSKNTNTLPPTPPKSGSGKRRSSGLRSDSRCNSVNTQFDEYQTLYETTKIERDKLAELVAVFQNREKEVYDSTCKMSSDVKSLQRQNVELEKKLARLHAQRSAQDKNGKKHHRSRTGTSDERPTEPYYVEELETQ